MARDGVLPAVCFALLCLLCCRRLHALPPCKQSLPVCSTALPWESARWRTELNCTAAGVISKTKDVGDGRRAKRVGVGGAPQQHQPASSSTAASRGHHNHHHHHHRHQHHRTGRLRLAANQHEGGRDAFVLACRHHQEPAAPWTLRAPFRLRSAQNTMVAHAA